MEKLSPKEQETSALKALSEYSIESAHSTRGLQNCTPYAEFLFERHSNCSYFYIPATNKYCCLEITGNLYHGYKTTVTIASRTTVALAAQAVLITLKKNGCPQFKYQQLIDHCKRLGLCMNETEDGALDTGKQIGTHTIEKVEVFDNTRYFTKNYTLSNNVQADAISDIIAFFETDAVVMTRCHCSTFNEDGHPLDKIYYSKEDLSDIHSLPSPYISFTIEFRNTNTKAYVFSLLMDINSPVITYAVNKGKLWEDAAH